MELIVASLIIVFICCGCIIYYKLEFFEWTAICLDYLVGRSMAYHPEYVYELVDRKSTRLNSSHDRQSRMPSSA